jgi:hypothetical protein
LQQNPWSWCHKFCRDAFVHHDYTQRLSDWDRSQSSQITIYSLNKPLKISKHCTRSPDPKATNSIIILVKALLLLLIKKLFPWFGCLVSWSS